MVSFVLHSIFNEFVLLLLLFLLLLLAMLWHANNSPFALSIHCSQTNDIVNLLQFNFSANSLLIREKKNWFHQEHLCSFSIPKLRFFVQLFKWLFLKIQIRHTRSTIISYQNVYVDVQLCEWTSRLFDIQIFTLPEWGCVYSVW